MENQEIPVSKDEALYPYQTNLVFILCLFIGLMGVMLFLKLSLRAVPMLAFTFLIHAWVLAKNELDGFFPETYGVRNRLTVAQFIVVVLMTLIQFFLGIFGTMSY